MTGPIQRPDSNRFPSQDPALSAPVVWGHSSKSSCLSTGVDNHHETLVIFSSHYEAVELTYEEPGHDDDREKRPDGAEE